jgi:hypothetical protein
MTIAGSRRLALFESAKNSWGEDPAQTLMDYLPFDPDAHATKADIGLVKADLAVLDANLRSEMAQLGGELRSEMAQLGGELRSEMAQQTRLLMITMLTTTLTVILAVLGAALAT